MIRSIIMQVAAVCFISATCSYVSTVTNDISALNGVWAFLVPAYIAVVCNDNKTWQMAMIFSLMALSFIMAGVAAVAAGY